VVDDNKQTNEHMMDVAVSSSIGNRRKKNAKGEAEKTTNEGGVIDRSAEG
jgi:hypothetical protein